MVKNASILLIFGVSNFLWDDIARKIWAKKIHLPNFLYVHILWQIYLKSDPKYQENDEHMDIKNVIFD